MNSKDTTLPYKTFLESVPPFGNTMGHDGILALLNELGNFHQHLKVIHIAGTNGKGSSTKILSAVFKSAGYKVGTFTSPYIIDYKECISIDEIMIDTPLMNIATHKIEEAYNTLKQRDFPLPTHYECITVTALMAMYLEKVDLCIIETLMGGLNDATNIFTNPLATLITSISFDHMEYLGSTLSEIATHKAGIIKEGCPVIINKLPMVAQQIMTEKASSLHAQLYKSYELIPTLYTRDELHAFINALTLKGKHQEENLYGALSTLNILKSHYNLRIEHILEGLESVDHPCRIEEYTNNNLHFIFDGAHNEAGIEALCSYLKTNYHNYSITFILGILKDKDLPMIKSHIYELSDHTILIKPLNDRSFDPEGFIHLLEESEAATTVIATDFDKVLNSIKLIKEKEKATKHIFVACGSLYLCAPFKDYIMTSDMD